MHLIILSVFDYPRDIRAVLCEIDIKNLRTPPPKGRGVRPSLHIRHCHILSHGNSYMITGSFLSEGVIMVRLYLCACSIGRLVLATLELPWFPLWFWQTWDLHWLMSFRAILYLCFDNSWSYEIHCKENAKYCDANWWKSRTVHFDNITISKADCTVNNASPIRATFPLTTILCPCWKFFTIFLLLALSKRLAGLSSILLMCLDTNQSKDPINFDVSAFSPDAFFIWLPVLFLLCRHTG